MFNQHCETHPCTGFRRRDPPVEDCTLPPTSTATSWLPGYSYYAAVQASIDHVACRLRHVLAAHDFVFKGAVHMDTLICLVAMMRKKDEELRCNDDDELARAHTHTDAFPTTTIYPLCLSPIRVAPDPLTLSPTHVINFAFSCVHSLTCCLLGGLPLILFMSLASCFASTGVFFIILYLILATISPPWVASTCVGGTLLWTLRMELVALAWQTPWLALPFLTTWLWSFYLAVRGIRAEGNVTWGGRREARNETGEEESAEERGYKLERKVREEREGGGGARGRERRGDGRGSDQFERNRPYLD